MHTLTLSLLSAFLALVAARIPPPGAPERDCNGNGIEDAIDIATGVSSDANLDGVPDECQEAALVAGSRARV